MAESFGADAQRYHRTRPSYPSDLVERLVSASPGLDALDVGCGTGIVAQQLTAAGCRVLGVEIDARMADVAHEAGIDVEVAKFETWDAGGRRFDAVTAGQTWHWVDPDAGAVKAAEVLRPDGLIALFWNVFQPPPDLANAFAATYARVLPGSPMARGATPGLEVYESILGKATDGIRATGAFGAPERWQFGWERDYTRAEWLEQVPTFGGHGQLAPDQRQALLEGFGAAIDAAGGRFTMPYTTVAIIATRSG